MMKKLLGAVLALILIPALARAEEGTPEAPEATETPAESAPETPVAPAANPAGSAAAPVAAPVQVGAIAAAMTPEQLRANRGFIHSLSLDHSVGSGTFVNAAYFADVGANLSLGTSYSFAVDSLALAASAAMNMSFEYSLPDSINGRRFDWSDIRLGLRAPAVFREKVTKITVNPSIGASIPISLNSIHNSTFTVLNAGVGFNRTFLSDKLMLNYGIGGSRGIHFNPANVQSPSPNRDVQGNLIYICRTEEQFCGSAGMNAAWTLTNSLSASYSFTDKLNASGGVSLSKTWRYGVTDQVDEFTPKAIDSNGNPVARVGMGQADFMSGSVSVGYALSDVVSISGSLGSSSPPKTADNKNFRFPFFDFVSPANNFTQFSLSLSARLQ